MKFLIVAVELRKRLPLALWDLDDTLNFRWPKFDLCTHSRLPIGIFSAFYNPTLLKCRWEYNKIRPSHLFSSLMTAHGRSFELLKFECIAPERRHISLFILVATHFFAGLIGVKRIYLVKHLEKMVYLSYHLGIILYENYYQGDCSDDCNDPRLCDLGIYGSWRVSKIWLH